MKVKIVDVNKTYEPFKMDNGGTIYSIGAKVSIDGGLPLYAKVRAFTDKIALDGEHETGKTVDRIDIKDVEIKGNQVKQITLYALKQDRPFIGKKGGYERMSIEHFMNGIKIAEDTARRFDKETIGIVFGSVLNNYCDHVKNSDDTPAVQPAQSQDDQAGPGNPFDDSKIPF